MGEQRRTDRTDYDPTTTQRLTVHEAADALGISEGAVRMRVKRDTLPSTREGGRLYVLLNTEPTPDPERTHERPHDRTGELIATLQEQLQAERRANEENRRIIAALTSRLPQLEAPQETPESSETIEEPERAAPRPDAPGPQTGAQRRPWWRRVFGG